MVDASWAPWPLRKLLASMLPHRDGNGDTWNHCHFWSNFEIADFAFFRSKEYRDFFDYLDQLGGFYFERWGDSPVHSLAAALFLGPAEIHRFDDIGYSHPQFWTCPQNAWKGQMLDSESLGPPISSFRRARGWYWVPLQADSKMTRRPTSIISVSRNTTGCWE